ncbi:InlB B-repeat-containing protein [Bengtsoniella intestinalis]|uniref:InlB B-repeat-containing protein n=1 Tax=Bengtsoniella intestinalis TaxID=3073143 RepID=UPI00391F2B34
MKKFLAWALTLIMTTQLLPLTVWAAELTPAEEPQVVESQETDPVVDAYLEDAATATMDDATMANLNSIWQQLETTGLVAYSELDKSTKVLDLSAFDDSYLTTNTVASTVQLELGTVTVPAGETSSFRWDIIGLNPTWTLSLVVSGVGSYNSGSQVYLTNSTDTAKEFTLKIYVKYAPSSGYDTAMMDFDGYTGMIYNALSFSNPVNMMFYQDGVFRDNGTVFMGYDKTYPFYGYDASTTWVTSYTGKYGGVNWGGVSDIDLYWSFFNTLDQMETDYKLFENTANTIFANGEHRYSIQTDWTMSGFVASGYTLDGVWMKNASIWPYDDSGKMGVSSYNTSSNYNATEYRVAPYAPFSQMDDYSDDVYAQFPVFFYLNASNTDFTIQNTLEMDVWGEGIPTHFYLEGTPNYIGTTSSLTLQNGETTKDSIFQTYTDSPSIEIYDTFAPTVVDVYTNDGFSLVDGASAGDYTYYSGQYVPITLEFSEPVDGSKLSVTINGVTYSAADLHMNTVSATQTAWYQVQDVDSTYILVSEVTGLVDLFGNTTASQNNSGANWPCTNVTLESVLMRNSVTGIAVDTAGQTVTLTLDQAEEYQTKYAAYYQAYGSAPFTADVIAPDGSVFAEGIQFGFDEVYDTTLLKNILVPSATLPDLPVVDEEQTYTVQITAYESSEDTTGFHLWWYDTGYGSVAKTQLESVEIVYPVDDTQTLSLTESYTPTLSVNYTPSDLTCPGGTWSSSDETIATIDADGRVALTGDKVGTVSFAFTANNGTDDTGDDKTATTHTYTVLAGDDVSLLIPDTFQNIVVRQYKATTVFWSSNANLMDGYGTVEYKVEVFAGNFATADAINVEAVYSATFSDAVNSYVIPENTFTELSTDGKANYTICVSIPATATTVELTALAWVTVNAEAAGITLTPPTSLYLTDAATSMNIGWDITNYAITTEGTLTITRIEEDDTVTKQELTPFSSATGTYKVDLEDVKTGYLKDTYMVTASVVNSATDADDMDGFIFYVYNDDALEIEIDGNKETAITLSNTSAVSGTLPTTTADILALREELALIEYIGINYDDYSWSMLKDGIAWSTSNDVVSINYKQGTLYENIDNFTMETYLPQTQLLLSSVTDGTATITATHANTGMSDSVDVTIDTLRDEFYLFQISPMLTTKLTYIDGQGDEKSVWTNSDGYLALYEPNGINSEVDLWAKTGDTVYLGSIAQSDLTSGERDSTMLQLYPLNATTMRQVAQLDLYVTNPDGSPFVGSLTLRGGVYVDGVYADQAQLRGNGEDEDSLYDGDVDQTVTITDGYLTVNFNSTQFWSQAEGQTQANAEALTAKNDTQYILELSDIISGSTEYYPQLVYSNATMSLDDIMYSASSIITLEDATGNTDTPFIANQYFLYEGLSRELDIQTFTGRIGPNANYESATVYTNMLLWGEDASTGYTIYAVDENGYQPTESMNKSAEFTYPFSSIPVVGNTLTLTKETMTDSGWITEMTDRGIKMRLSSATALVSEKTMPWRVLDMTNVEDVMKNSDVSTMVSEMFSGSSLGESSTSENGNAIISGLMGFVTPFISNIGGSPFNIIITPTENNAVFNCLIWGGYDGMGLDEVDYSETGLALESDTMNASISMTGVSDLMGMAGGDGDDDTGDSNRTGSWSASFEGQLQGYYQGEISYNFTTGRWEMHVLEGGFTAGFQGAASFSVDASASGIPLFIEVELGGAVQLDFNMATRYQQIGSNMWADSVTSETVNDYLTTLRLLASAGVFGGVGFDYSIVALKIGPYGEASIDSSNLFLTRDYLADTEAQNTDGQYLSIDGEIGAKLEATFLIFSTEVIFGSGSASYAWDWDASTVQNYWDEAATYGTGLNDLNAYSTQYATTADITALTSSTTLQSRDYLSEPSVWASPIMSRSLDTASGLSALQTNANPSSYPVVSDDGYHLLYISDQGIDSIYSNRVYATTKFGTTYLEGSAIDTGIGYGDSNVSVSGSEDFAAAAWVRMTSDIEGKDAGDAVTTEEQVLLLNSTEIMVSLWSGSTWTTSTLTTNGTPDIAPVVATNGTDKAIVAWRSVYSGTGDDLMNFEAQDYIMYSVYDGDTWSEAKTLYNGSTGSVMGIDAQMLPDGTAMVAYSIDRDSTDGDVTDYEIAYSIVDNTGDLALSTVVTSDNYLDENPQIVVADFGSDDERFVLGWYTSMDNVGDIRLLAVNSDGIVSNTFPESLAKITATTSTTISSDFQFAHMDSDYNDLENLTILWEDIITTDTGEADYSVIRAVSFTDNGSNNIGLTAMGTLAELPSSTLLDHFDAYVSGTNEVKAVIQSTYYDKANTTPIQYSWYDSVAGETKYSTVNIPSETTMLYTATETFENRVEVQAAIPDYQNLTLNSYNAIQFSVFNGGLENIESISITIDGKETTYSGLDLAPNDSTILTYWHVIGDTVEDTTYTLEATFESGDTKTANGNIYLDYPDVGISQMTTVSEVDGIRTIRMSLYNSSIATLSGDKGRSVEIAFYDGAEADYANPQALTYTGSESGISFSDGVLTISGEENLERIDNGVFMVELTYDVKAYVEKTLELTEIPDSGVRLYADMDIVDGERVLPELNAVDNFASVTFESLLSRTNETVTLDIDQSNSETATTATITLKNNSLQTQTAGGAMIVSLLDENGNALEQKQVYIGSGKITGEAVYSETVTFSQVGSSVSVVYGELVTGSTELAVLSLGSINLSGSDFAYYGYYSSEGYDAYGIRLSGLAKGTYLLDYATADQGAEVTVTCNDVAVEYGEEVSLDYTNYNTIILTVTLDNATTSQYTIYVSTDGAQTIDITPTADVNGTLASYDVVSVDYNSNWSDIYYLSMPTAYGHEHYVFDAWYYTDDTKVDWTDVFTANTTLVAKFTKQVYSVSDYTGDAATLTYESGENSLFNSGDNKTFTVTQNAGYILDTVYYEIDGVRYDMTDSGGGVYTTTVENAANNFSVYATGTRYYTMTFQAGEGTTMDTVTYYSRDWRDASSNRGLYETLEDLLAKENAIGVEDLPTPVANEGHRIGTDSQESQSETRWTDSDGVGVYSVFAIETWATENETFTARAIKVWDTSFVSGDSNGTVGIESNGIYDEGTAITLPTVTPNDGYVLDSWNAEVTDGTVTSGDGTQSGLTETFTATFKAGSWNIYYPTNLEGVSVSNAATAITFGTEASFELSSSLYTVDGVYYTVAGTNTKILLTDQGSGTYTIPASAITGDISITIEAAGVQTGYFMAGANGTVTGQTAMNVATNDTVDTTNVIITPDTGYELDAWSPADPATTAISAATTFTAGFKACTYTLTLDALVGTYYGLDDYSTEITVTYGEPMGDLVVIPAMEYMDEYIPFIGWYIDGNKISAGDIWTYTEDQTATPSWWYDFTFNFYDSVDNTLLSTQYVDNTYTYLQQPANPTREGYTFENWYEEGVSQPFDFSIEPDGTQLIFNLYAQWTANDYTLAFDLVSGTGSAASKTVTYGSAIGTLGTPTKAGYTFDGWSIGGVEITADTIWSYDEGKTAVANWVATGGTAYTVIHEQQNLDGSYSVFETENKTGYAGTTVTPSVKRYTGFTSPSTQSETIAGDGSLVITYEYARTLHDIEFVVSSNATTSGTLTYTDVMYGDTITVPIVNPKTGYTFDGWDKTVSTTVTGDVTYIAQVNIIVCTVQFLNDVDNTAIDVQKVNYGDTLTLPDTNTLSFYGYEFSGWSSYTYIVTSDVTIYAYWTPIQYKVSFDANGGEGIMGNQTFSYGEPKSLTANAYVHDTGDFMGWSIDSTVAASYEDQAVVSTLSTTANEIVPLYAIWGVDVTWDYNDGATANTVTQEGIGLAITVPTNPSRSGYTFDGWFLADGDPYDFATLVTEAFTLTAQWTEIPTSSGSGTSYYASTVTTAQNGTVTLSGSKNTMNTTVTITPTPDDGYAVDTVTVAYASGKTVSVTAQSNGTYTYLQPGAGVTITVTFVPVDGEGETISFSDVSTTAYYYDAVVWAVENGITAGYADGTFRPTATCTRAQAVTFLWRAAGEPQATIDNPFADLDADSYYYEAVLWAVSEGITAGTTATTFSPNEDCSRGQIVTFLYRAADEPEVAISSGFTDVDTDSYCYNAVLWTVENGITNGTTEITFSPNSLCNRGQIVTFLYRNLGE